MGILIGMDEAGYGPNFGPLVVAATAWEVAEEGLGARVQRAVNGRRDAARCAILASDASPNRSRTALHRIPDTSSETGEFDLYSRLRNIVAKSASERRIAIADSKVLYNPTTGLRQLERGVHTVLLALQAQSQCWSSLVRFCQADPENHHQKVCWPVDFNCNLPVNATGDELVRLSARFVRACAAAGIKAVAIRARLVYPAQFNELVDYYGSKGAALSHVTVGLLRDVVDATARSAAANSSIYAVCDKHGARNYYTALLQHHFSEHWIEPVYESHSESRYEWGLPEARVRINFRMNGERFLPTALASMTAKYLRELAMRAFNEFWSARVPNLRPTAGYPMDSHRFRKAIAAKQLELGIDDHELWRNR
jgi:hypothetical protein